MFTWKPEYATGHPDIDAQHKVLFRYINQLEELCEAPAIDRARADRLMVTLEGYVANHFNFEQKCTHRYQCPTHAANIAAHEKFSAEFKVLQSQYASDGPSGALLRLLHAKLGSWLDSHILKIDTQMRKCPHKSDEPFAG